ncbi:molybdopterin converting factor subunit 1 [Thiobacillus sedimenti]|uniref:Molybdopterin synthase sulfur carrier subunit n=1 Tax=Thiobacillus sedimenti TaxID=3110231 RepID=A0ABZ1CGF6_9PROT|nr:molybdopterin converting factor subunit 1 [Thiobacillus sp. SCUT-2]WRS37991.1 molybdopterin converting factor subunit 1 [Thiobacillus sp. SCUT-2]
MSLRVLYFARLRERLGLAEETLDWSGRTVADLVAALRARGGVWEEELGTGRPFRVAVNQDLVALDAAVPDHAEVAIFPPVTGG